MEKETISLLRTEPELYNYVIEFSGMDTLAMWSTFRFTAGEGLVQYRSRLRELCEDLALHGYPRYIADILACWRYGLYDSMWNNWVQEIEMFSVGRALTTVEVMYAMEEIASHLGYPGGYNNNIIFLAAYGIAPEVPDFSDWRYVTPRVIYAQDFVIAHRELVQAQHAGVFRSFANRFMRTLTPLPVVTSWQYPTNFSFSMPYVPEPATQGGFMSINPGPSELYVPIPAIPDPIVAVEPMSFSENIYVPPPVYGLFPAPAWPPVPVIDPEPASLALPVTGEVVSVSGGDQPGQDSEDSFMAALDVMPLLEDTPVVTVDMVLEDCEPPYFTFGFWPWSTGGGDAVRMDEMTGFSDPVDEFLQEEVVPPDPMTSTSVEIPDAPSKGLSHVSSPPTPSSGH